MCLSCSALETEDAVLWIDADVVAAPQDMLPKMIASDLEIITPNCYFQDTSWPAWRQKQWYFDYNVFQNHSLTSAKAQLLFPIATAYIHCMPILGS